MVLGRLSVCIYICIFFCSSNSAQYVATRPKGLQVHPGICGCVLDSHPTHAKSVDHEMNSHKYNGGKSKEQPPEKLKKIRKTKNRNTRNADWPKDGRTDR